MKRMIVLVMTLCLLLSGCQQAETPQTSLYQEGTYTGSADGRNAAITVEVTLSTDAITEITITEESETKGIAEPAYDLIPTAIIEHQSLAVDTITGCTITSEALINAVANALETAGADVESLRNAEVTVEAQEDIVKTADVIIVGAGGAGVAAALSASEAGASVILIEKTASVGGNTLAGGGGWNAVVEENMANFPMDEGRINLLKTYLDYEDDMFVGEYLDVYNVLKQQINDYLQTDMATIFDSVEFHIICTYLGGLRENLDGETIYGDYDLVTTMCENSTPTMKWLNEVAGSTMSTKILEPVGGLWTRCYAAGESKLEDYFNKPLAVVEANGGEVMVMTTAKEFIVEDGKVTGVNAELADGTKVILNANKGVVLTTGGYGANPAMLAEYDNYWGDSLDSTLMTTNVSTITGDGIVMADAIGAELVGMDFAQLFPTGDTTRGANSGGNGTQFIMVNKDGKRFVNEGAERDTISKAAFEFGENGGEYYALTMRSSFPRITESTIAYEAETLEEVATLAGINVENFVAEVEKYNTFVETGVDEDFGKTVMPIKYEVTEEGDTFVLRLLRPSVHHTMGGVKIDADTHVYNIDGNIIEGLYAAGEVTGGIQAGNRVGGNAITDIFVFGKIAGESAAATK